MKRDDLPSRPEVANQSDAGWREVYGHACIPYRHASRWAWHWSRGKLAHDPVFRGMLERGDLRPGARVVDIGCGQGLVASLLHACEQAAARGVWPGAWPPAPSAVAYTGIELMPRDAARGNAALQELPFAPRIACADMRDVDIPPCDLVVILDVLHYVDHAAQERVLQRVRAALASSAQPGRLLLRVGDAADTRAFKLSQVVDHVVTLVRGHRAPPTWGRPLAEWKALLHGLGFEVHGVPMSQGTPFANVLLVADLPAPRSRA